MTEKKRQRRSRRTCADRLRRDLAERQRQRGVDPAGKVALQLLGLLSGALALVPPMPRFSFSFRPAWQPDSSIDDDRGPTAYAMERGLEPLHYATSRLRPPPSWLRLVKDLKRSRTADRARELLEERVPPAALEWLREAIDTGNLWRLRMIVRPGAPDDEIAASMLAAAHVWEAERQQAETPEVETPGDDPEAKGPKP
jgi:hypothetical protein